MTPTSMTSTSLFLSQELLIEANMNQFSCVKPQKSEHTKVKTSFICLDLQNYLTDSLLIHILFDVT